MNEIFLLFYNDLGLNNQKILCLPSIYQFERTGTNLDHPSYFKGYSWIISSFIYTYEVFSGGLVLFKVQILKTYWMKIRMLITKDFNPMWNIANECRGGHLSFVRLSFFLLKQMIFYVIICISFVWSFVKQIIDDLCHA